MIILPDKNIPRSRILMPVPRAEWMPSSQFIPKDHLGNETVRTRFRLTARLHDGHIVWRGWFRDRDDADAFLFAMASGSLRYERPLWDLPSPAWHPDMGEGLIYNFVTQTILSTTGSNQTYTSPSDWNNGNNTIECLGGGGGGASGLNLHATGGGGAAYSRIANFSFATPGTTTATYRVGAASGNKSSAWAAGGTTWFNDTVDPGVGTTNAKCSAVGGSPGTAGSGSQNGGTGGQASASWGEVKYSGGNGGNLTGASGTAASGAGGAAGPSGAGGNGSNSSSTSTGVTTAGGSANNGTTAGGAAGALGVDGTEFDASNGCGSGAGGRTAASSNNGRQGGSYGGGGGAMLYTTSGTPLGGDGPRGLIVIEYTPGSSFFSLYNMPNMGM